MTTGQYPLPRPRPASRGRRWLIVAVAGSIIAAAGAFLITHALLARSPSLPAGALVIPANVGTAMPTPAVAPTAAPLAASQPTRIEIPALGVSAPMTILGLGDDGTVQVPPLNNHNLAGWYKGSVTPGQQGTAVILGHVDSYTGESVFFNIKTLKAGDQIKVVRADGSIAVFAVDGVQKVVKATFPAEAVYANTTYPSLRLITCGGPFDKASGQYLDNIVVYSHLIN